MYQMRYEDVMEDGGISARERETILFDRCVELLKAAEKAGPLSQEALDAAHFIDTFWLMLIEDLGSAENSLPAELKASLISIGMYIMKEVDGLRSGKNIDFEVLISILGNIRAGLAQY